MGYTCTCTPPSWVGNRDGYPFPSSSKRTTLRRRRSRFFTLTRAASPDDSECNTEECAPEKEIGQVSRDWLAGEKTKVVGTFPPRTRGWTGYVEKDTAGQTNIYSIEPTVYVAESALSSGTAGSSSEGAENTAAVIGGIALISLAAASSLLIQVYKNPPLQVQTAEYKGPSLSYYISKFKPAEMVEVAAPSLSDSLSSPQPETSSFDAPQTEVQPQVEPQPTTSENVAS